MILERPARFVSDDPDPAFWRLHATAAEIRDQLSMRRVPVILWSGKTKAENIELLIKTIKAANR
jgi:hypothetical protein